MAKPANPKKKDYAQLVFERNQKQALDSFQINLWRLVASHVPVIITQDNSKPVPTVIIELPGTVHNKQIDRFEMIEDERTNKPAP